MHYRVTTSNNHMIMNNAAPISRHNFCAILVDKRQRLRQVQLQNDSPKILSDAYAEYLSLDRQQVHCFHDLQGRGLEKRRRIVRSVVRLVKHVKQTVEHLDVLHSLLSHLSMDYLYLHWHIGEAWSPNFMVFRRIPHDLRSFFDAVAHVPVE